MVKTFIYVPVVEDLKQHLLIRHGVHQSVGTEQQELVLVPGQLKGIRLGVDVRAKCPGDEIAIGVCSGLQRRQIALATIFSTTEWSRDIWKIPSGVM